MIAGNNGSHLLRRRKRKAPPGKAGLKRSESAQTYGLSLFVQPVLWLAHNGAQGKEKARSLFLTRGDRRCASCGCRVTNRNLGGHDGHSLSGNVWCLLCADATTRGGLKEG
jgi:hypothetical protein